MKIKKGIDNLAKRVFGSFAVTEKSDGDDNDGSGGDDYDNVGCI